MDFTEKTFNASFVELDITKTSLGRKGVFRIAEECDVFSSHSTEDNYWKFYFIEEHNMKQFVKIYSDSIY